MKVAPDGATSLKVCWIVSEKFREKSSGDLRWRILLFHKLDVTRIAELAREFCDSTTGNTDKIYVL
jgi:hypothetical protein